MADRAESGWVGTVRPSEESSASQSIRLNAPPLPPEPAELEVVQNRVVQLHHTRDLKRRPVGAGVQLIVANLIKPSVKLPESFRIGLAEGLNLSVGR